MAFCRHGTLCGWAFMSSRDETDCAGVSLPAAFLPVGPEVVLLGLLTIAKAF